MLRLSYFRAMLRQVLYIVILHNIIFSDVTKKVIRNDSEFLIFELSITAKTEADLYPISILVGLPEKMTPQTTISYENEAPTPFNTTQKVKPGFDWVNSQELQGLETATLRLSPLIDSKNYYQKIKVKIAFDTKSKNYRLPNSSEIELLKNRIINWEVAKNWIIDKNKKINRMTSLQSGKWFQFFLSEDGISAIEFNILDSLIEDLDESDPRSFSIYMGTELGRPINDSFDQPILDH